MNKPIDKFQALLRELFQFDYADLDFYLKNEVLNLDEMASAGGG